MSFEPQQAIWLGDQTMTYTFHQKYYDIML